MPFPLWLEGNRINWATSYSDHKWREDRKRARPAKESRKPKRAQSRASETRHSELLGAHVTATSSAANLELCRRLGADVAADYRATDALSGAARYELVLDVFGNRRFREARGVLARRGVYVTTVPKPRILLDAALTLLTWPRARLVMVRPRFRDLAFLAACAAEGALVPLVEHVFPLDRIADAEEQLATKHTRGKVIVRGA